MNISIEFYEYIENIEEISMNISIVFYEYIENIKKNINKYFDKNIYPLKMIQNSCKCLKNFKK